MAFTGEIFILNKLADLSRRLGTSPIAANASLQLIFDENDNGHGYHYSLSMVPDPADAKDSERVGKFASLLGLDKEPFRNFADLREVEKVVDHALSLVPRARVSDR